jgi:hypothetical protein
MSSFIVQNLHVQLFALEIWLYTFCRKKIGGKAALKMLVKLTYGITERQIVDEQQKNWKILDKEKKLLHMSCSTT